MTDFIHDAAPMLRYRRIGGGYRREDVEAALGSLLDGVRSVEASVERLHDRSLYLESELRAARAELQAYHARERRLEAALRRAEDALDRAGAG